MRILVAITGASGSLYAQRLLDNLDPGQHQIDVVLSRYAPAVIAEERRWTDEVFARNPAGVAVLESALIFEVERDARARGEQEGVLADWRRRMDRIVVVTAPDELKIARYASRVSPAGADREAVETAARRRLAHQNPDAAKAALADYVIDNAGDTAKLRTQVERLWQHLKAESNKSLQDESLE